MSKIRGMNVELEQYLDICEAIYRELERTGNWPWLDSHKSEDVVDSES